MVKKEKRLVLIALVLFLFMWSFMVNVQEVGAHPGHGGVKLELDRDYYLRGEKVELSVNSTYPNVEVQIFDPDNIQIYDQIWNSNTARTLPVSLTAKYGTYVVRGTALSKSTTSWFTVLDITGWSAATVPYTRTHNHINYTFFGNYTISVQSGDDLIYIDLSALRSLVKTYSLNVAVYQNSMNFLVRFTKGTNIKVDVDFAFIHEGAKLIINGTISNAMDFPFNFHTSQLKSLVNSISSGSIVFDWSDMVKVGAAFTYNSQDAVLTVHIPPTFRIDPVVFSNGFEDDYASWTLTSADEGNTIAIDNTVSHHGTNSSKAVLTEADGTRSAYAAKILSSPTDPTCVRSYFDITDWGDSINFYFILGWDLTMDVCLWEVGIDTSAEILTLYYLQDDGFTLVEVHSETAVTLNAWHSVEVRWSATGSYIYVFFDGESVADLTVTDIYDGNVDEIDVGAVAYSWEEGTVYIDCVVVDDAPIGIETGCTIGEFLAPATVYANQEFFLNGTIRSGTGSYTDFVNATIHLSNDVVFKWINSSNTFSIGSDVNGYATITVALCVRTIVNETSYKLSWYIKLSSSYPTGSVDVVVTETKVFDTGSSGSNNQEGLFTFSLITMTLQARDADGANLPTQVTFKGTLGNGTALDLVSDTNGYSSVITCYGSHTINIWWGTHLVQTSTQIISEDSSLNIDTKIHRLDSGINYALLSLNSTSVASSPTLLGSYNWRWENINTASEAQFKMDCINWVKTSVPYSFTIDTVTYTSGTGSWSFAGSLFTFTVPSSAGPQTLSMSYDAPEQDSGSSSSSGGSWTSPVPTLPPFLAPISPILPPVISPDMIESISALPPLANYGLVAIIVSIFGTIGYGEMQHRKPGVRRAWHNQPKGKTVKFPKHKREPIRFPKTKQKKVKWRISKLFD